MTQTPTDALRLVPVEPTREMIEAGASREWSATYNTPEWKAADRTLKADYRKQAKLTFKAMLAAAPASPLPGGGWLGVEHLSKAITRLTQVVAGDQVEAAYADFTFPGHTFRADIRAVLSALPAAPTGEPK